MEDGDDLLQLHMPSAQAGQIFCAELEGLKQRLTPHHRWLLARLFHYYTISRGEGGARQCIANMAIREYRTTLIDAENSLPSPDGGDNDVVFLGNVGGAKRRKSAKKRSRKRRTSRRRKH